MAKIGVIGEKDFAMLFCAVGLDVFYEETGERASRRLFKLAKEGYSAIFVQEKFYKACQEVIAEYKSAPYPAILPVPDSHGSEGVGIAELKQNVEKAVGVDILFNK